MIKFKNMIASLAVAASAGVASAGSLGQDGLDTAPSCSAKTTALESLSKVDNDTPTGIMASTKDWKMEILADPQDGSWTLVGESLKVGAQKNILCVLNTDIMGFPNEIAQEAFYKTYFVTVPVNQAKLNEFIRAAKGGGNK
jgi:hypothetical protein